jgi:DNA-binding MarR family transcriptional regulator
MKKTVTKADYETLAAFRYALRQFLRFSEEVAQGVGLTPQQYQALLMIKGFPDRERIMIGEMAERLQVRHHSAVGLIDRLVAQGLVVRTPALEDKRQVYITLTPQGEKVLDMLAASHRDELRLLAPQLNASLERLIAGNGNGRGKNGNGRVKKQ